MQYLAFILHFRSHPGFQIHTSMWIVEIYEHCSEIHVMTAMLVRYFFYIFAINYQAEVNSKCSFKIES